MSSGVTPQSPQQAMTEGPTTLGSASNTSVTLDQPPLPRVQFHYHQHRGSDRVTLGR